MMHLPRPLLNIPVESLHEILSYLPPSMLLVLRQVSQALLAAVDDEAIWRACFGRNYLFGRAGAVSRSCLPGPGGKSWKKEALGRERLLECVCSPPPASRTARARS